jgi:hypothetical protein
MNEESSQADAHNRSDAGHRDRRCRRVRAWRCERAPDAVTAPGKASHLGLAQAASALWVPKMHATWAYAPRRPLGQCPRVAVGGRFPRGRPCDDFRLVVLKLIFLIVTRCRAGAGLVPAGGVVEGHRDPDAAPSARCGPARAASRSFAVDVAGPGVAGPARRDAASRPTRPCLVDLGGCGR